MRFHWSNGSESLQSCQKLVSINVKKYTEASEACKLNIFTARTVRPQTASLMYDIRVDWPEQNAMIKSLFVCTSAIAHTNVMWSYQRPWRKNNPTSSQERERDGERQKGRGERNPDLLPGKRERKTPDLLLRERRKRDAVLRSRYRDTRLSGLTNKSVCGKNIFEPITPDTTVIPRSDVNAA